MPSTLCPKCDHAVTYLDDLIGTLQCPGCGEDILHGREQPHWDEDALQPHRAVITAPPVHHVELEADDEAAELRAAATVEEEPLPGVVVANRPGGVGLAGALWLGASLLALALTVPLLIGLTFVNLSSPSQEGFAPAGVVLGGSALAVLAVVYYAAVARAGRQFRRGASRHVQLPAWLVLLVSDALLLVHLLLALVFLFLNLTLGLGAALLLMALDCLMILASAVLLWQSGRYAHWARGAIQRPVPGEERAALPGALALAGAGWLVLGLVALALTSVATTREGVATLAEALVFGSLVVVTLTPVLLGLTLLAGRLSSATVPGWTFLAVSLGLLAWSLYTVSTLPAPAGAGFDWVRTAWLANAVLYGVGAALAVVCLSGDGAYRHWLRTTRGLHV